MGFVAIAAGHAGREHLALLKRAIIVDLVKHLSVRVIKPANEERDGVSVGQWLSRDPVFRKLAASRMAQAAGLDLPARRCRRDTALRIAGLGIGLPGNTVP